MKSGTLFRDTNYEPGIWFKPQGSWLQQLYQDKKLSYAEYISMSAKDFPLGHSNRKRDADEALRDSRQAVVQQLVATELETLRTLGNFREHASFPEVEAFLDLFQSALWRRPILLIVGGTNLGKSMLAAAVLERLGKVLDMPSAEFLEITVEGDSHLDFSDFDVSRHSGVLLDGVSDTMLLKSHRETLQGRPKIVKGAKSATMKFSYPFTLARRGVVATMDLSADNMHLLQSDHWLSDPRNIIQLHLKRPAYDSEAEVSDNDMSALSRMQTWSVRNVVSFLKSADLEGPAAAFWTHGVNGIDFASIDEATLCDDLRLSRFTARKVLAARASYLQ